MLDTPKMHVENVRRDRTPVKLSCSADRKTAPSDDGDTTLSVSLSPARLRRLLSPCSVLSELGHWLMQIRTLVLDGNAGLGIAFQVWALSKSSWTVSSTSGP